MYMANKKVILTSIKELKASSFFVLSSSIIIPTLTWVFKPNETINLSFFVAFVTISVLISYLLYLICKNLSKENNELIEFNQEEARVLTIMTDTERPIIVLNKNKNFKVDMMVSLFYLADLEVEKYLGIGKAFHIQEQGIIQVQILSVNQDIDQHIINGNLINSDYIKTRIKVKPYVSSNDINEYFMQGE